MPIQPSKTLKTYAGFFNAIRLDFTPEPPLEPEEKRRYGANYPTRLAYVHVYLNGKDAAELVPSAYCCPLFEGLFDAIPLLVAGKTASADWYSDPWKFDFQGIPQRNQVSITLHVPEKWVAMQEVIAPLDQFMRETVKMGKRWLKYLDEIYHEEVIHPEMGKQYRQLEEHLKEAEKALREYESR